MKTNIGIKEKDIKVVSELLNKLLADENVLYTKVRNAHWNIEGSDFHAQHIFFEEIYGELAELIDEVAERVRALGHYAVGTMKGFLEITRLSETKYKKNDSQGFIKELLSDFESLIISIREDIKLADEHNDAGTEDFLVGILAKHEKTAWMLRAHLA
ncbi:MAG: Dps family protein [Sphingobacterium sp.]